MKQTELFEAKVLRLKNGQVKILQNPSKEEMLNLVKLASHKELRGLAFEGNIYIWDSFTAIHYLVKIFLKTGRFDLNPHNLSIEFFLTWKPDPNTIEINMNFTSKNELKHLLKLPLYKRMVKHLNVNPDNDVTLFSEFIYDLN